ncbi:MAG: C1 family peptidase [Alphaproteobacteria bacterium]|nr:C1 family peptidase [Alphaproteobacteria bacterium]
MISWFIKSRRAVCALMAGPVFALGLLAVPATGADPAPDTNDDFGTGLVFEPEPVYRSFPAVSVYRAFLPPKVDLSERMPPVGSQGRQSSCVGWATAYGLRGFYENRLRGRTKETSTVAFSPSFVYNQIKSNGTDCRAGTSIADALNLLKRVGTVPLDLFPYDPATCSRQPDPGLAGAARPYRIDDWKRLDVSRIDDFKGQLYAGNPVVVGMLVNDAFHRLRGEEVFTDENHDGNGHAMVVVGYDDNQEAFKLFNSWGTRWGNAGFGWVGYDTFRARVRSAFVMQVSAPATNTPAPPERPAPVPAPTPALSPPLPSSATGAVTVGRLAALVAAVPCSDLRTDRDAGGRFSVRGVVGSAADGERLAIGLRGVAGLGNFRLDLTVLPWPQCEAHKTFGPALENNAGLGVRVQGAAGPHPVLADGAPLVVEITTPSFASQLYVIYLQAGGDAVFLHTPAAVEGRPWPPRSRVTIGDGRGGQPAFAIGPPFGDEMILVLAVPQPLFASELPASMTEREFLSLFRKALLGHGTRGVQPVSRDQAAAAYSVLTTQGGSP